MKNKDKCVVSSQVNPPPYFVLFLFSIQFDVQVSNVTVTDYSFVVCLFRPDTSYTVRLRHRYKGPESPWSPWSKGSQGRTGEDGERKQR